MVCVEVGLHGPHGMHGVHAAWLSAYLSVRVQREVSAHVCVSVLGNKGRDGGRLVVVAQPVHHDGLQLLQQPGRVAGHARVHLWGRMGWSADGPVCVAGYARPARSPAYTWGGRVRGVQVWW